MWLVSMLAALAAPVAADSALAQEDVRWTQSPMVFFPGQIEAGEGVVEEDASIIDVPFLWMAGATLSEDVTLDVDGDAIEIASGTVLPAVLIQDDGAERFVHCTRSRIGVSGNTQGGMFGGLLVQAIESLSDAQTCLEDTDSDGLLDTAFVLGRGPRDMLMIGGIEPVDFETGTFLPVEGEEDYLRIRLDRVGRRRVDLDVDIVVQGRGIQFDSLRTGRYLLTPRVFLDFENGQEKPAATEIFGMVFEVFASDRRADQASLRWYPEVPEEEMVVVPNEMTTRYY